MLYPNCQLFSECFSTILTAIKMSTWKKKKERKTMALKRGTEVPFRQHRQQKKALKRELFKYIEKRPGFIRKDHT